MHKIKRTRPAGLNLLMLALLFQGLSGVTDGRKKRSGILAQIGHYGF